MSSKIMKSSAPSPYWKEITVEFIIVEESEVGLQTQRHQSLMRLWELVVPINHRFTKILRGIGLSSIFLESAISDRAQKLDGETYHIFVCVLRSTLLNEIQFNIMTGIHVGINKAISWDLLENPENPVLTACKPPIPCLKKVRIDQKLGSDKEELRCAICLHDFSDGSEAATTKCFHLYHCHCIVKWLSRSSSCPMCRSKLPIGTQRFVQENGQLGMELPSREQAIIIFDT